MLDIEIRIDVNDKKDIPVILEILKKQGIESPVYIIEFGKSFYITFRSNYDCYDIDYEISNKFGDYEFKEHFGGIYDDVRIEIVRTQSPFSTDDWGRGLNTNAIVTTRYLIPKQDETNVTSHPNFKFKVLFDEDLKDYFIEVVAGINKTAKERGFLILKPKENDVDLQQVLDNKMFKDKNSAFWHGFEKISLQVEADYMSYIKEKKKLKRKKKKENPF